MKFTLLFAAVLSVALGFPAVTHWTLPQLSAALQDPNTNPAVIPILEDALNQLMLAIHSGSGQDTIAVMVPTPVAPELIPGVPAMVTSEMTLHEVTMALENPKTDPSHIPILEAALNQMMAALMSGNPMETISVTLPAPGAPVMPAPVLPAPVEPTPPGTITMVMTLQEITYALESPNTDPAHLPYLEAALNKMMAAIMAGEPMESIAVTVPVSTPDIVVPTPVLPVEPTPPGTITMVMTLQELSAAIQDPSTDPAHIPYLEDALNTMMSALMAGHPMETIVVTVPASTPDIIIPSPVLPEIPSPEVPAPEPSQPAASAPLIQIIVNVNQQSQQVVAPVQLPEFVDMDEESSNPIDVIAVGPQ